MTKSGTSEPWYRETRHAPDAYNLSDYMDCLVSNTHGGIGAGGPFLGYFPGRDRILSEDERSRLRGLGGGGFNDRPTDFKLHLSPHSDSIKRTAAAIMDTCRQSSALRSSLYEMKFWAIAFDHMQDEDPRIALYPRGGSSENAAAIVAEVAPVLGSLGVRGSGLTPRFNVHLSGLLWYVAQGSGWDKANDTNYREEFDPSTNWAIEKQSLEEFRQLVATSRL